MVIRVERPYAFAGKIKMTQRRTRGLRLYHNQLWTVKMIDSLSPIPTSLVSGLTNFSKIEWFLSIDDIDNAELACNKRNVSAHYIP
jgi:hypothetical protein